MTRRFTPMAARLAALALIAPVLGAADVSAQWRELDGEALPAASDRASENGFGVMLGIADEAEGKAFREEWHSTAVSHAPQLETTQSARRGDIVSLAVLYAGCGSPAAKADAPAQEPAPPCNAMLSLRVIDPDGATYSDIPPMSLAQGQASAPAHITQLSPVELKVRFEPEDPLGEYRIEARVELPERGIVLTPWTTVTLLDDTSAPKAPSAGKP